MALWLPRRELLLGAGSLSLLACDGGGPKTTAPAPKVPEIPKFRAQETREGMGATVQRLFPGPAMRHFDPFVLLDDFSVAVPAGFPDHPHRGFEALTYMVDGAFHHKDNLGNDSWIASTGTQRFTSGRGARHSEMPGEGGDNRGLQLWVNLPAAKKKMTPSYEGTDGDKLPVVHTGGAKKRVVVGGSSPVELQTPVVYEDFVLPGGTSVAVTVEEGWNALVYVLSGAARVGGTSLDAKEFGLPPSGQHTVTAMATSRVVFLSGKPQGQPIVQRGPFVD